MSPCPSGTWKGTWHIWDHQSQLHKKGDYWHLEGKPNHWAGRRGHAPSKAAEVSKNLLNHKEGILWSSARDTGRSKGERKCKTSGTVTPWAHLGPATELQEVAAGWHSSICWHTPPLCTQHRPYPALGTFSAAPREVLAAHELHFLGLPSIPPPGVSCLKHGPLPAGAGGVNLLAFAGVLKSWIKIGHGLNFLNLQASIRIRGIWIPWIT